MFLDDFRCLFDFNYRLFNNLFYINVCLCKWKVDVKEVCIMCIDIEIIKYLIYECKVKNVL